MVTVSSLHLNNHDHFTTYQVSGFLLAEDLRQTKSAVYSTAPSTPALTAAGEQENEEQEEEM